MIHHPPPQVPSIIRQAEAAVRDSLKDPDSAKFSGEASDAGPPPIVCGRVNAKNSYGGYEGDQGFAVISTPEAAVFINDGDTGTYDNIKSACPPSARID
jgi:hypothetical protein